MLFIITGLCDDDVLHKLAVWTGQVYVCVCVGGGNDGGSGGIRIGTQNVYV